MTLPRPAGAIPGDVLVAGIAARLAPAGTVTAPVGWQLVRRDVATAGASYQQLAYVHVASASDPPSWSWKLSATVGWSGSVLAYAGIDTAAPVTASSGAYVASTRVITAPSVTSAGAAHLVGLFGNNGRKATTPPAGMRERTDRAAVAPSTAELETADAAMAAGSSGPRSATSNTSNSSSVGQLLALRPLEEPPPAEGTLPDFALASTPAAGVTAGESTSATVTVSGTGGFAQPVSLSASGAPAGASATIAPASVSPGGSATLTVATTSSTAAGTYPIRVDGVSGGAVRSTTVSVTVGAPAPAPAPAPAVGASLPAPLPQSTGQAFYVSPSGSDAANGSIDTPWRTVQKAFATLQAGQTAFLRGGVYAENVRVSRAGTATSPITVRSYPGETAVLRPSATSPSYPIVTTSAAAYVRIQGLVIERAVGSSTTNVYVDGSRSLEISDCEIRDSQRQGIFVEPSSSRIQILRNTIHHNGSLTNAQQDHGIYIEGSDHLIANNVIHDQPHGYGIQVYPQASRVTVTSNTIVGNALGGIVVGSDGATTASDTVIVNNVLASNKYAVVTYWGGAVGTGNVARSNLAWGNTSGQFSGGGITYTANVVADPAFVDAAARDLRLGAGSPGLDRGETDFAPRLDRTGQSRPHGAGPDLGAYEQ